VSSDDLLQRFVQGDREAISAVAGLVRRIVYDRGYWIPRDERDDVVQEAVVKVYQAVSAPGFRIERDLEGYVRSTAHHGCVDWIRRHRPAEDVDPRIANPAPGPDAELAARERLDRGRRILGMLGTSCLRLIRLRVRDRLSHREIAERLGRTEGGVRNQFYKCLERARAIAGSEA
jgi:RNA polymerase sigma factor (sigma-70 family)